MARAFQTARTRYLTFPTTRLTAARFVALHAPGRAVRFAATTDTRPWSTLPLASQQGLPAMHPFAGGLLPPRVNPTPNPAPTAPATIPTVPQTPRCAPVAAGGSDGAPGSVSLPEATSRSSVACCGGKGAELSPLRTLVICPALASTQTPARLQTCTSPSNTITFMVLFAYSTKKSVPTTPATPAGVRSSNFPAGLVIFCACVRSFP